MAVPSVYAYLDHRAFLTDWIAQRRDAEPDYSYATFARAGGCSKAALANVLSGARRPRPDTIDAFARAMALTPAERNYLGLLVDLDAARDIGARRDVMERLLSTERFHQLRVADHEPSADVLRYVEHWYIPVIRELATLAGFRADPVWIAGVLRRRISPEEARAALDTLRDLEFLREKPGGGLEPCEVRFRTHEETMEEAAEHVHRVVIPGLLKDLDTDDSPIQHLLAATLTIAPSQVPEFKARLNALVDQLATLADDKPDGEARRVYQLAVQLLPLSDEVVEDEAVTPDGDAIAHE